jgi:archaetidylinositol phosphate synthase
MPEQKRPRLNASLLGSLERPALSWLAAHMPSAVTPDHLTAIGVLGAVIVFTGYLLCWFDVGFLWVANAGLVVNWLGDSMDGTLARFRNIERHRYGFFIDHTTDLITQVLVAFGLGLSPYVRFDVACLALIAYLLMAAFAFIKTIVTGMLQIAFSGIGPTEARLAIMLLNIWIFAAPPRPLLTTGAGSLSTVDIAVLLSAAGGFLLFARSVVREARRLAPEDPRPMP